MANLDLSSIWSTVLSSTSSSANGSLSQSVLTSLAQNILSGLGNSSSSNGLNYASIATQLLTLYTKYKSSSNTTEVAAANNVKSISDIIGAMGGDKSSMVSAGLNALNNLAGNATSGDSKAANVAKTGLNILGGLFGKKS